MTPATNLRRSTAFAAVAVASLLAVACGTAAPSSTGEPTSGASTSSPALSSATPTIADQSLAPDFTLPSAAGGEVKLSQFRGNKDVVLVFYRAYW
jgi:cytochrome oxidase Cu insertion factor (SCO1/SenC/PrrC family)